jgi:uncharacterized lipoprotein YddW (UPF0748 family)
MVLPPAAPAAASPRRCSEGAARWALRPGRACSLLLLLTLLAPQAGRSPAAAAGQPRSTAGTTIAPPSAPPPALNHRPTSTRFAVRDPAAPAPASGAPARPLPNPISNPLPGPLPGPLSGGLPAPAASTPEPALGVWLTTVDSAVMYSPAEAQRALAFLRHNGFRRAALPLYTAGVVTWSPAPARNRLAIPTDPLLPPTTTAGPTASLLAALGRAGLERVGWFEFGLMAPAGAPWLVGRDDLLLRDASGSSLWQESPGLNRVWLNPILPEVQQLLEDLVVDACTQLPLEAIQFDDHLGYPVRFGYDPATLAAWRATDAGRRNPSPAPGQPAWIAWRAEQVTALLERLRAAMNSACPAVRISVSPNPQEFSYSNYLADWSGWVRRGLVDEVVVQIYRDNLAALARELAHPSLAAAAVRVPVRIGLLAGLKSQPKDPAQLRREFELVQGRGYRGIDLFFYESARRHFNEPQQGQLGEDALVPKASPSSDPGR